MSQSHILIEKLRQAARDHLLRAFRRRRVSSEARDRVWHNEGSVAKTEMSRPLHRPDFHLRSAAFRLEIGPYFPRLLPHLVPLFARASTLGEFGVGIHRLTAKNQYRRRRAANR